MYPDKSKNLLQLFEEGWNPENQTPGLYSVKGISVDLGIGDLIHLYRIFLERDGGYPLGDGMLSTEVLKHVSLPTFTEHGLVERKGNRLYLNEDKLRGVYLDKFTRT